MTDSTTTETLDSAVRRTATASVVSGVLGVVGAVITLVQLQSQADVPTDQWSHPSGTTSFLWVSLGLAVTHVLSAAGFTGVTLLNPGPLGRAARSTLWVSVVGLYLLAVAEVASGLIGGRSEDSGVAGAVGTLFGIASLLTVVGGVVAGIALLRRGWTLGGASLLANGLVLLLLVTPANIAGSEYGRMVALTLWSLTFVTLGHALRTGVRR